MLETEEYVEVYSSVGTEMNQQDCTDLIEQVIDHDNLYEANRLVKANKGTASVDGITVDQLFGHMKRYYQPLRRKLRDSIYRPQPVKRAYFPKEDGTKRKLGILSVLDRVVQQAIYQVMVKKIDPCFSKYSYGFRPKRNAKQATKQAARYYRQEYNVVVDCDLKSCFDTINHKKSMEYVKVFIQDEVVLKLIWKFLRSGTMEDGLVSASESGA